MAVADVRVDIRGEGLGAVCTAAVGGKHWVKRTSIYQILVQPHSLTVKRTIKVIIIAAQVYVETLR